MRIFNVSAFDYPGCAFAILLGGDDAGANLAKHRHGAHIEHLGCFNQRDFAAFGPFAIPIDGDAVRVAEAPHARLCPSIQSACSLSCPVEHAGNSLVRHQSRAGADQPDRARPTNAFDPSGSFSPSSGCDRRPANATTNGSGHPRRVPRSHATRHG